MYDTSTLIKTLHDEHVTLTRAQTQDMQRRRETNLDRLKAGLKDLDKPAVVDTINQGGNAMQTMTQPPESDEESRYDIDMGVVFEDADAKTPKTTRGWVRDAIAKKATNLKSEPEAKRKCVRVIYAEGYQCDFPVFKRKPNGDAYTHEIAIGDEWTASDPQAINMWFAEQAKDKSPEESSGFQLRRIVRFLKYFSKVHAHRTGGKFPAGLVATALAVECYQPVTDRDDEALYETLKALKNRSEHLPVYANGVEVSDAKDVDRIKRLRDAASDAVDALADLVDDEDNVTADRARKAWKKVFRHSFFDSDTAKSCLETKAAGVDEKARLAAPAILALTEEERLQRAEAAVREVEARGPQSKPWAR